MGLFTKLTQALDSRVETNDHHTDEDLHTRYYKASKDTVFKVCHTLIQSYSDLTIISESPERGELSVQLNGKKGGLMIITVIMVRAFHTAVDITVTFDKGFQMSAGKKLINEVYEKLSDQLPASQK